MKIKNVQRCALALVMSVGFVLPQIPQNAGAAPLTVTDLFPSQPVGNNIIPGPNMGGGNNNNNSGGNNNGGNNNGGNGNGANNGGNGGNSTVKPLPGATPGNGVRPNGTNNNGRVTMNIVKLDDKSEYKCSLLDNRPHAELIAAIDAMNKEVSAAPECSGQPSAKTLEDNGKTLKETLSAIQTAMAATDASTVSPAALEQSMTQALGAIQNIGNIINNNAFLNSRCGRQSMSTGKVLLAVNDIISGFAPYALFAVSMNAALAPALPFVVGGVVASAGISAVSKLIEQNTLDMSNPDHRKALLVNTCQYTKIATKVRFMRLAQSGKIETITKELEKDVDLYNTSFTNPTRELSALLKYRDAKSKSTIAIENQYTADSNDLVSVESQMGKNNDDLMVCTLAAELVNWAQDGKTFPTSAFNNLEAAASQSDRAVRLQAASLKALNLTSIKRITEASSKAYEDEGALRTCAAAGRSWVAGVRQAITMTYGLTTRSRSDLESELSANAQYTQWKAQYTRIQTQKVTINRVEKAMEELAKDNSIIDRSELAQRMSILKSGLFGSHSSWGFGTPPVLAWINYTKKMHDQAVSALATDMKALRIGAHSLTDSGKGNAVKVTAEGMIFIDPQVEINSNISTKNLATLNKTLLPVGSRENEMACQQLESAWLDWSAAIDHLGAVQFFCDMIDPVLDPQVDTDLLKACRGDVLLNGRTVSTSVVNSAKNVLVKKGYLNEAQLVSDRMKDLECPMPSVSVMNE